MRIELTGVSKSYGKKRLAIKSLDLEIASPGVVGLVGPNGAGKSTLMKMLVTQILPTTGGIRVDGKDLRHSERYLKERLGYLPQEFGLYDELTVEQFLDYMACLKGLGGKRRLAIEAVLAQTHLEDKRNHPIRSLSGGQKQRVGIAQALLNEPDLLIVDEPTVGLDPEERIAFRNLLATCAKRSLVILSTHIVDDIESVCNQLIVLHEGLVLFNGRPSDLIHRAEGHVGTLEMSDLGSVVDESRYRVTSRVITPGGAIYRIVAQELPVACTQVSPRLEDAYVYCMLQGGEH
ncbi:MAG: ATP-binding cassette domain-containing protein [Bacillota bacterium]